MSYESEERYWTDYLRVALPVIGLLLMLALFWWWAQEFIGDDGDPTTVANATQTAIATIAPPTPTATTEVVVQPTEETDPATEEPDNNNGGGGEEEETPDDGEPEDCEGDFARSQVVVVTADGVNMREEPDTTQDNVVEQLDEGTELTIVGDCFEEDADGNQFWRVRNSESAETGYVAGEFLEAAEDE
ncbi:MAG: SH3 domain-containing protein [Chloroflexota bacterium]|nr:SH3 domain-containing protein [Chloroflexota bacterium]